MPIHKDQRVGVFIDVQNLYYSAKQFYNSKVNFAHILKKAVAGRSLIRAIAYVIKADIKEEHNFFEALEKIGYEVRAKELQTFYTGAKKGDWDVGIAMDIMRMASKLDVIILVSGDGDFKDLLEHVKALGCRAEVLAFGKTASSRLTNEADQFHDLGKDLDKVLIKDSKYHPPKNGTTEDTVQSKKEGVENVPYQRPDGSFEKRAPAQAPKNISAKQQARPMQKRDNTRYRDPRKDKKPQQRGFQRNDNYNERDEASLLQRINMDQPDLTKINQEKAKLLNVEPSKEQKSMEKDSQNIGTTSDKKSKQKKTEKKPLKKDGDSEAKKSPKKKESVVRKVINSVTKKKKK